MALLTQTVGWFVDHFPVNLGPVEKTGASIQLFAQNMAEGVVLILLGLFVGLWAVRRKRQSLSQSD
jgi:F0F1-type ATP synthase assembly protein I